MTAPAAGAGACTAPGSGPAPWMADDRARGHEECAASRTPQFDKIESLYSHTHSLTHTRTLVESLLLSIGQEVVLVGSGLSWRLWKKNTHLKIVTFSLSLAFCAQLIGAELTTRGQELSGQCSSSLCSQAEILVIWFSIFQQKKRATTTLESQVKQGTSKISAAHFVNTEFNNWLLPANHGRLQNRFLSFSLSLFGVKCVCVVVVVARPKVERQLTTATQEPEKNYFLWARRVERHLGSKREKRKSCWEEERRRYQCKQYRGSKWWVWLLGQIRQTWEIPQIPFEFNQMSRRLVPRLGKRGIILLSRCLLLKQKCKESSSCQPWLTREKIDKVITLMLS